MNLVPALRRYSIATKMHGVQKFEPNWAQIEYINRVEENLRAGKPNRFIILKARQIGLSTATEAMFFNFSMIWDRWNSKIMSKDTDSSAGILKMTKLFWETSPWFDVYNTRYAARNQLEWVETNSNITIGTAGSKDAGRSSTLQGVHASEVAFWPDPSKTMLSLLQTVPFSPQSFVVLESTANGVGDYFWEQWNGAVAGDTEYIPLFFPWWKHPEYVASYYQLPYKDLGNLDPEERVLRNAFGLSDDRLAWRRYAIRNLTEGDIHSFHQEYPATPEEAFVATGTNAFDLGKLNAAYEPIIPDIGSILRDGPGVRFAEHAEGNLRIFKHPHPDPDWGQYFVSGDPTHTTTHDFAAIQVINRRTYEQVAVWRGRIDPYTFAEEVAKLGRYYNDAIVTVEATGPGSGTIGVLISKDYPFIWKNKFPDKMPGQVSNTYGWQSNVRTKEWAIGQLRKLIIDQQIKIHDHTTYMEMMTYVRLPEGGYGPVQGEGKGHDDTVTSLAIACICNATEDPLAPYGMNQWSPDREDQTTPDWGDE